MNFRIFITSSLFFSLMTLAPTPAQAEPDIQKILLYGGAFIATVGVIKIANERVGTGLTLIAIGGGMAAVAKPDKAQRIFDNLLGRTHTERTIRFFERNFDAAARWLNN